MWPYNFKYIYYSQNDQHCSDKLTEYHMGMYQHFFFK